MHSNLAFSYLRFTFRLFLSMYDAQVFWNLYPPSAMASVGLLLLHLVVLVASRWGTPSLAAAPAAAPRRALRPASKQR